MPSSDLYQAKGDWRRLGIRLAVFFLPIVIAWAALECWAANIPNIYSAKRGRLESLTNEVDTLIIGSSGAYYGIEPQLISGSIFNLAGPQEGVHENDALVTRVLPMLPKLKRVILHVNYAALFVRLAGAPESWRQYCYYQEWGIPPMQLKDRLDCRMWSRLALRTPRFYLDLLAEGIWGLVRSGRFALDQPEFHNTDDRGWCAALRVKTAPPDLLGLAQANHELAIRHGMMRAEWESGNLVCLDHLLSILRQRNIEVVFIVMPAWHTFREVQSPECWQETQRVLAQRTNNENVRCYSFLTALDSEPQDFYDVDHLNPQGAGRLTQLLNSRLNGETQDASTGRQ